MAVKVIDASALAALLFGEPAAETVAAALGDARLVAPTLLSFELANVCLIKSRRYPDRRAVIMEAFKSRHTLGVEEIYVDHDRALELAALTGLTAYDASYLWLKRQLGVDLVTLDKQLARVDESMT